MNTPLATPTMATGEASTAVVWSDAAARPTPRPASATRTVVAPVPGDPAIATRPAVAATATRDPATTGARRPNRSLRCPPTGETTIMDAVIAPISSPAPEG